MVKIGIHVIVLNMRKLAGNRKIDRMLMFVKNFGHSSLSASFPGAKFIVYMVMYFKHFLL